MSLVAKISSGVAKAQTSLGDLVISLTVIAKLESVYDPLTSTVTVTDIEKTVDAVPIDWDDGEVDGALVKSSDLKFVVFSPAVPIDLTDIVEYNSGKYKIMNIKPIRVGSQTPVRILQLRA